MRSIEYPKTENLLMRDVERGQRVMFKLKGADL